MGDIPCPKDGCDKTCGSVPNLKNHIHMMSDSAHPEQGNDAWQLASQAATSNDTNSGIQHTDPQENADDDDTENSNESGFTLTELPGDDSDGSETPDDGEELPCGHETVPKDLLDKAAEQGKAIQCDECGQTHGVE